MEDYLDVEPFQVIRVNLNNVIQPCEYSMSLLQHPLRALDQVEWYLDSPDKEQFPGAFLLAAGNLARQVLEQVLFILAFYSGMPRNKFRGMATSAI